MGLYDKIWASLFRDGGGAEYNAKHPEFGAIGSGVADDTIALQALFDKPGDTTAVGGSCLRIPDGVYRITDTLDLTRRSGRVLGNGPGSSTYPYPGTIIKWDGAAGIPMIKINQCWGLELAGIRFMGKSSAKPNAAIEINATGADAIPNTRLNLHDLWIGHFSGFDADAVSQFTSGIITSGSNLQCDQSVMDSIMMQTVDTYGIRLSQTQNVSWQLSNMTLNCGDTAKAISTAARYIIGINIGFLINAVDVEMEQDSKVDFYNIFSEGSGRFCTATGGGNLVVRGGYMQTDDHTEADGNIIDIAGGGQVHIEDFHFTRGAGFAGTEKIKMRGTNCVFIGVNNIIPPGHTMAGMLDLATTTAGDKRAYWWTGGATGNYSEAWVHGDTGRPTSKTQHQPAVTVEQSYATLAAGNNNDYAPGSAATLFLTGGAGGSDLTGISGGCPGRRLRIVCSGTNYVQLVHNSSSSSALNRIYGVNATHVLLNQDDVADLEYDDQSSTQKWRVVHAQQ